MEAGAVRVRLSSCDRISVAELGSGEAILSVRSAKSKVQAAAFFCLFGLAAVGELSTLSTQAQEEFYPRASACSYLGAPPGTTVTIAGTGFTDRPGDVVVTFGGIKSQIKSVRERAIECVIPDMPYPAWNVPIVVTAIGVKSREKLTINVHERPIENPVFPR
jgi:hypothetical protein